MRCGAGAVRVQQFRPLCRTVLMRDRDRLRRPPGLDITYEIPRSPPEETLAATPPRTGKTCTDRAGVVRPSHDYDRDGVCHFCSRRKGGPK